MSEIIEAWAWYNGYRQENYGDRYWRWFKSNQWVTTRQLIERCKEQMMNL